MCPVVSTNKLASDSNGGTSAHLQSKRSKNERTDVARESSHRVHIDLALLSFSRSLDKKCCVVCVVSGVGPWGKDRKSLNKKKSDVTRLH